MKQFDIIIIGGGILGLSFAYHAARSGKKVLVLEKEKFANGASIRNFGQIVPSGFGRKWQIYGKRSIQHYTAIQEEANIYVRKHGSLYLASNEEENTLLQELHQINAENEYPSQLLNKKQVLNNWPAIRPDYVTEALYFEQEMIADSFFTIPAFSNYLQIKYGVSFLFGRNVLEVYSNSTGTYVVDHYREKWYGGKTLVCTGADLNVINPEIYHQANIQLVKLQMMQTIAENQPLINASILTGLTIRRYEAFAECPSFHVIKNKEDKNHYTRRNGIHILFKQNLDGSVIIGDSHHYAEVGHQADLALHETDDELNEYILSEASKILSLNFTIAKKWNGVYCQLKEGEIFTKIMDDNIHVITGIGGKGMTASLGWSEEYYHSIL